MNIIRGLHNAGGRGGCVLTIGNFDGVHRGHQAMLERLGHLAQTHNEPALLLTFEPHPVEVLAPDRAPARLTRFGEKVAALAGQPLSALVAARFDTALASMSPQRFIREVLVDRLRVKHLLVGDDFHFGRAGAGDIQTLREAESEGLFEVSQMPTVRGEGQRISSTRIRALLAAGDLAGASGLLGRPFSLCGRVGHGQKLGRTIGFPTANLALRRRVSPVSGVYAVSLVGRSGERLDGVANVGRRPTVRGIEERLEVHVFDFDGDLYGQPFQVFFHAHLRAEQKFDGLDALKAQIRRDADAARAVHQERNRKCGS